MSFKKVLKAAFTLKNTLLFTAVIAISAVTQFLPFFFIGLAGYVYFVLQTLKDDTFVKECTDEEKADMIQTMDDECNRIYDEVKDRIGSEGLKKVDFIIAQKDELISYFKSAEFNPIKHKMVEQVLNLAAAFIKLKYNLDIRFEEYTSFNLNDVYERMKANKRKLQFLNDQEAKTDIEKAIEMDQSIIDRMKEEKIELEKMSAKLDYIESAVEMFKHKLLTEDESFSDQKDIDTVITEAEALGNVLKNKERV